LPILASAGPCRQSKPFRTTKFRFLLGRALHDSLGRHSLGPHDALDAVLPKDVRHLTPRTLSPHLDEQGKNFSLPQLFPAVPHEMNFGLTFDGRLFSALKRLAGLTSPGALDVIISYFCRTWRAGTTHSFQLQIPAPTSHKSSEYESR